MKKCILCRSIVENVVLLGKLHTIGNISVHQHCLYLSSNLVQRGNAVQDEKTGILDFQLTDIQTESERTNKLMCCYCTRRGANIGCCKVGCRKCFHTLCGISNGAQNQFAGTFKSFCKMHVEEFPERPSADQDCSICFEQLIETGNKFIYSMYIHGCCCNNGWYHKACLQKYASSAGYFFKCPLCNNDDIFRLVELWGISVPDRDASWEEGDAYAEHYVVQNQCTAVVCRNWLGRFGLELLMLYCILCGSNPMHLRCTKLNSQTYCCNDCRGVGQSDIIEIDDEELDPLEIYATDVKPEVPTTDDDTADKKSNSDSESDIEWFDESAFPLPKSSANHESKLTKATATTAVAATAAAPATTAVAAIAAAPATAAVTTTAAAPAETAVANSAAAPATSAVAATPAAPATTTAAAGGAASVTDIIPLSTNTQWDTARGRLRSRRNDPLAGTSSNRSPRRTRSRSLHTIPLAAQDNQNEEAKENPGPKRNRSLETSPMISRRSQRIRNNGEQENATPLDQSCVGNRTRARSRK